MSISLILFLLLFGPGIFAFMLNTGDGLGVILVGILVAILIIGPFYYLFGPL